MDGDINTRILEGITDIRGKRYRPNYNTILSYLNRGNEIYVDMATVEVVIEGMLSMGTILDKGTKGGESFYLNGNSINTEGLLDKSDIVVMEKTLGDIDESFHNVIFEKIHTEVKSQLTPLLSDILKDASFINEVKGVEQVNINYDYDPYVKVLTELISHLNEQVVKKDNVIELLISKIPSIANVGNATNDIYTKEVDDASLNIDIYEKNIVNTANVNVMLNRKHVNLRKMLKIKIKRTLTLLSNQSLSKMMIFR